jgi:hypothetical protein
MRGSTVEARHARATRLLNRDHAVILAGLTAGDFERFHAAHVRYSGATGAADPRAYIATFPSELPLALAALGWRRVKIKCGRRNWIVRRRRGAAKDAKG